jgi:hypothetical protein
MARVDERAGHALLEFSRFSLATRYQNCKICSTLTKRESGFTPLVRLPAICVSNAFDIRRYTRADFAGTLDRFRLRRRHCARSFRAGLRTAKSPSGLRSTYIFFLFIDGVL